MSHPPIKVDHRVKTSCGLDILKQHLNERCNCNLFLPPFDSEINLDVSIPGKGTIKYATTTRDSMITVDSSLHSSQLQFCSILQKFTVHPENDVIHVFFLHGLGVYIWKVCRKPTSSLILYACFLYRDTKKKMCA